MKIEFDPLNRDEATAVRLFLVEAQKYATVVTCGSSDPLPTGRNEDQFSEIPVAEDPDDTAHAHVDDIVPETDSSGTPWDARIHSTPAKINADGTWRAKRGVTPELVAEVKRELEAASGEDLSAKFEEEITLSTEAPPAPLSAPTNASTQNAAAPTDGAQAPVPSEAPPAPLSAPTPPPVPGNEPAEVPASTPVDATAAPSSGEPSFLDVMKAVTAVQKDGKMATPEIVKLAAAVIPGATSTMALNGKENGPAREAFLALLAEAAG